MAALTPTIVTAFFIWSLYSNVACLLGGRERDRSGEKSFANRGLLPTSRTDCAGHGRQKSTGKRSLWLDFAGFWQGRAPQDALQETERIAPRRSSVHQTSSIFK